MKKQRKFPQDVARFFNPQKSGTNAEYNNNGILINPGTHQKHKMRCSSNIIVYNGGGTYVKSK